MAITRKESNLYADLYLEAMASNLIVLEYSYGN